MSQRFYFDLVRDDDVIVDDVGVDAIDLAEAIAQSRVAIDELRSSGQLGNSELEWDLIIRDERGQVAKRVPLRSLN